MKLCCYDLILEGLTLNFYKKQLVKDGRLNFSKVKKQTYLK